MRVRLDRLLANMGVASRRDAKRLILAGRVTVNGRPARKPGLHVDPSRDAVALDGRPVDYKDKLYYMFYKPVGYVVSTSQRLPDGIMSFFTDLPVAFRLFPVGRLDRDAEGLLIMTDDGELSHRLTHPKYGVPRVYRVVVNSTFTQQAAERVEGGVDIGGHVAFAKILKAEGRVVEIEIREGKYHEVKRIFASVGFRVVSLKRTRFGPVELDPSLRPGEFRELSEREMEALRKSVGLR